MIIDVIGNKRICIVGAGIGGVSAAYFLAKKGYTNVTLLEKNDHLGKDIPNSNIRANLYHGSSKDVIINQSMIPLLREDEVQIMMSVESKNEGLGLEAIKPKGEPTIPSIILSMRMTEEYDELLEEQIFK